jgi:hypothetical protein
MNSIMVRKLVPSIYPQRLCWLVVFCVLSATAVADEFDKFFGVYHGEAISDTDGELQTRDLRVTIEETDGGFNLTWTLLKPRLAAKCNAKSSGSTLGHPGAKVSTVPLCGRMFSVNKYPWIR